MQLEVIAPGSGIALQDAGRTGWRRYGVPIGGAMDRHAMGAVNALLGNRQDAPVLEIQLQGTRIKVLEDGWLGLAGANSCPVLSAWSARRFEAGAVLDFSAHSAGIYAYLAAPGGFVAEQWFGSVSVDPRNGLGAPLAKGSVLSCLAREPSITTNRVARRILKEEERRTYSDEESFNLLPGPQFESFSEEARSRLVLEKWTVSKQSDRTGFRLEGPPLEVPDSIPSEPVLSGSFQVPGNGQPIITMVDGPTVGGYPKIAILKDADRDRLAQCRPGTQLCFQWAEF